MKNIFQFLVAMIIVSSMFASCDNSLDGDKDALNPSANFDYTTVRKINLQVKVNDTYNNMYFYMVEVFDQNPFATDTTVNAISVGVARADMQMQIDIVVPTHVKTLFIQQTDPLKRKTVRAVTIDSKTTQVSCDFTASVASSVSKVASYKVPAASPKATDYPLPATYTTLSSAAVTLMGANYYLPAGVTNSALDYGWLANSQLYVAGNLVFNSKNLAYFPANSKLVVLPGGSVTFNTSADFEQNGVVVAVHPSGNLLLNSKGSVGQGSVLINDGTTRFVSDFEIRANSVLTNNNSLTGTYLQQTNNSTFVNNMNVTLSDQLVMNSSTLFENNGNLTVTKAIRTNNLTSVIRNNGNINTAYFDMKNGGGTLLNNCKVVAEDFGVDGALITCATGTIIACQDFYANGTTINLNGNAILKTSQLNTTTSTAIASGVTFKYSVVINGIPSGTDKPLVTVWKLNNKIDWQVLELKGTMEFALAAGQAPGSNYFKSISTAASFVEKPTVSIASTSCNDGGVNADNGTGVPEGPTFPLEVSEQNSYTFAMEDLWPNLGDYDMNDFVFSMTNIKKMITSDNKVLSLKFDLKPLASGSKKKLSAALQFDNIAENNVTVSSTNSIAQKETGHSKANITLFPTVHSLFGRSAPEITNTYMHIDKVATQTYSFAVNFGSAVSSSDVIVSALNFYVIVGDNVDANRSEVHLAGFNATDKGIAHPTGYKDTNNMVWAIMIPVVDFKYPTEKTKIYSGYKQFSSWASSGGQTNADWYLQPTLTGGLVYSK